MTLPINRSSSVVMVCMRFDPGNGADGRDDVSRSITRPPSMRRAGAGRVRPDLLFVGISSGFGGCRQHLKANPGTLPARQKVHVTGCSVTNSSEGGLPSTGSPALTGLRAIRAAVEKYGGIVA